ncbi:unnamed protein product, partial [Didymodactylos carnosus]
MAVYKSVNNPMRDSNIFAKMFVPLELRDKSPQTLLWQNSAPNSSRWTCPIALIAEQESEDLLRFVNDTFEPQERRSREEGIKFVHDNETYEVEVHIEASMKDLKVRMMESGLGGADCLMCTTRQSDWKDVEKLNDDNYFNITRTSEKTLEIYNKMIEEEGEIVKKKNDYETRTGLTSESLSECDHSYITVTHQYINGTTWFLKMMYHMKSNLLQWTARGQTNQDKISKAKTTIIADIEKKTGLRFEQHDATQ